jgi:hypothetical protein
LLADPSLREGIAPPREHVRQNFLLTRHLGDVLALMATLAASEPGARTPWWRAGLRLRAVRGSASPGPAVEGSPLF